jgi:hypothetical protein
LTYESVSEELSITVCNWCFGEIDHDKGWANISEGVIHWKDRKVSKPGLRNFLKLYIAIAGSHNRGQAEWWTLWQQNTQAYFIARYSFGAVLGAHLSRNDRARALFLMQRASTKSKDYENALQWAKEILKWAR